MDGNIRLTLILLGIGLMVHAGYVYSTCEMMMDYVGCGAKKEQAGYEGFLGMALMFLGKMKGPKKD